MKYTYDVPDACGYRLLSPPLCYLHLHPTQAQEPQIASDLPAKSKEKCKEVNLIL